jgi:cytoskeletal protein CcmA (bactofilin family)
MSDLCIPRGQTATLDLVEGELRIGNNAAIQASNGKNVTVTKGVYLEGKAYVNCDLECESLESGVFLSKKGELVSGSNRARLELTGRFIGELEVNGNLTVHKQLNVSHSVKVTGSINADSIDVGGKIEAGAVKCGRIRVGGRADIQNMFEAGNVEVGGKVVAPGTVKIGDLHVGGEIEVGGGSITGNIRVGGKFTSKSALEFGELMVYGKGSLPEGCKGRKISTFGKLEVDGNLTCDYLEVGGVIEIDGDCHSEHVEVGGKLEVGGSLVVLDKLEGYGSIEIGCNFECAHLRLSGKLEADKVIVREEADISGKLETKKGLKAKLITVRSGSRCEGALIGEHVEIGKSADLSYSNWGINWATKWAAAGGRARVDDIYAGEVTVGSMSTAARIFANKIKLEQYSVVQQATYTDEIVSDFPSAISEPSKKVETLPPTPF